MNFETTTKDSIDTLAVRAEKQGWLRERFELTNKVFKRLALWGMLSTVALPVAYTEALASGHGSTQSHGPEAIPGRFYEQPGEGKELDENQKPVIAIAAESDITGMGGDGAASGFAEERFTRDELIGSIFKNQHGRFVILDRSDNAVQAINQELKLQATDLFDPSTKAKVRHLEPDYYVYVSEKPKAAGGHVELNVSVINMKTGGIETTSTTIPGPGFDDLGRATLERLGEGRRKELIARVDQLLDQL